MKKKVYFRADAGAGIGYGHFIRSLALADMLKSDFECVMFTQEPTPYQKAEAEKVCQLMSLPADESRFDKFLEYLTGDEIVVLDNYFFSTNYQQRIKDIGCKLVCIDDIHNKHFVSDIVINHGIVSAESYDVADYTMICSGPRYALLRAPFRQQQKFEKVPGSWVVSIGGSDELNITTKAVDCLKEIGVKDITVIIGDGYLHNDVLKETGVAILSRLPAQQMAETFAKAENVLCSASTVCYEALSQGCKVYAGWYVDNQFDFFLGLVESQHITPLFNLKELSSDLFTQALESKPLQMSKVENRIKGLFITLASEEINYIDMQDDFSQQVWKCRNLDEICVWMTNQNKFSFDSHQLFLQTLKNNDRKLYKALFFYGKFLASFDLIDIKKGDSTEWGFFINPEFQSMGIGEYLEHRITKIAKSHYNIHLLKAEVLKKNLRSYCCLKSVGYNTVQEDDTFYYMEKEI